ncbi:WhiB family transcriptional regulator [Streptomyces sp. XY593]|uniref:WhiB family transcriptional regulator n=1 Tax=Streptomyces sp. XY593 TaxID=1519483 RepID=UPI0007C6C3FB|nr:WhiB family transcriptional regulator [Streptomyces sp. XY593]
MTHNSRTDAPLDPRHDAPLDGPCRSGEREVFERGANERAEAAREREEAAKAVCHRCPVRLPCRRRALADRVLHGVRGGLTPDERHLLQAEEGADVVCRRPTRTPRGAVPDAPAPA